MERLDKFSGKPPLNRTSNLTWDPLTRTVVCKWLLSASTSIWGRLAKRVWSLAMDAGKGHPDSPFYRRTHRSSHRKETSKMGPFVFGQPFWHRMSLRQCEEQPSSPVTT